MTVAEEKVQKALAVGNNVVALRKRLLEAKSVLTDEFRKMFRLNTMDPANKRMLSDDGKIALQWQLRHKPDEPESYHNQQTNSGNVIVVHVTPIAAPTGPEPGTWAHTARMMAEMFPDEPGMDWDKWKDEMKEAS